MTRRWILTAMVAAVLVVGAVFAARAIRDDTTTPPERATAASTRAPSSSTSPVATAPPDTTAPVTTTTLAPATGDAPGPCGTDTASIRTAVSNAIANASLNAEFASCRLAASDPSWAAAQLTPRSGTGFTSVTVILHGGAGSWAIVATGGTNAGCGTVPQQVIVDLGQFCAGSGGSGGQ